MARLRLYHCVNRQTLIYVVHILGHLAVMQRGERELEMKVHEFAYGKECLRNKLISKTLGV
jgi:hypothetical protein